jgi:pyruvate dehydrogenase E1 component alpha subunit
MAASRRRTEVAEPEPRPAGPPVEKLLDYYRQMLLIRRFEEKAGQLYGMGLIGGFCHLYIGQEAVAVGIQDALQPGDSVITGYRDHGHMLVCNMDPRRVMAELTGRSGGYSKGKGGSMHMFAREVGFYGGHGIVGGQIPLGTGIAFAHKYREDGGICVAYMGDGAVNQGQVYESFNMAALWKLPVLYVIENNGYAMGTSEKRHAAVPELWRRGEAYGIPGREVDGMDVLKVHEAAVAAVEHVRGGNGPMILEAMTYRYRGHSMSDPAKYRSKEEVQEMRERHDPIDTLRKRMLDGGGIGEDALKTIDKEIRDLVNEAARYAQDSPEPDPEELWTDVLVET